MRTSASLGVLQDPRGSAGFKENKVTIEPQSVENSPAKDDQINDPEAIVEESLARVDKHGDTYGVFDCLKELKVLTSSIDISETATRNMLSDGRLQHLINRTVSVANAHSADLKWEDILDFMEAFVKLRLRAPLRDIAPICFRYISAENNVTDGSEMQERLSLAAKTLSFLGQGMVYHPELFDFTCHSVARAKQMTPHTMAVVLYEAGRHGLRTKHYTDVIVPAAAELAPGMSLDDLRMAMRGLMRFVKDWRAFFDAVCVKSNRVKEELSNMTNESLIMLMRVGKELRASKQYNEMQKEVAVEISARLNRGEVSGIEQGMVSMYMDKDSRYSPAVYDLAYAIQKDLARKVSECCTDISVGVRELLSVTDIVDLLDCWASWNLPVEQNLWDALLNDLALCRLSEIK
ncbi:hypothetical protein FOL47_009537 [Perkinsus chesapeaki]|uniref:Uncharacterized protein n=1 Tax=Perkinsus chesapeaki TaxID=330153 RepID=A0A7J6L7U0_PERCH|nr:hypothetical protein FOL47_009537 [Perkinsus chesapeaki]